MEPDAEQRALLSSAVVEFIDRFLDARADARMSSPPPDRELIASLLSPPPGAGGALGPLLARLDAAIDTGFDTASGGFLSYIPTGGLFASALGSFLATATNRYTPATPRIALLPSTARETERSQS